MKHNYNQKCKEELHLLYFHDGKMETMAIDDEKLMAQVRRIFGVKEKPKRVWSPWEDYGVTTVGLTTHTLSWRSNGKEVQVRTKGFPKNGWKDRWITASAKCHPSDKYDYLVGRALAAYRLTAKLYAEGAERYAKEL